MQLTQIASVVERQLNNLPPLSQYVLTMHPAPGKRRLMTYAIRVVTGPRPSNRKPLFGREGEICTICGRDHCAASCPTWKGRTVQKSRSVGVSFNQDLYLQQIERESRRTALHFAHMFQVQHPEKAVTVQTYGRAEAWEI